MTRSLSARAGRVVFQQFDPPPIMESFFGIGCDFLGATKVRMEL
jgi:hypothetical protein